MKMKDLIIVALATFCLTSTLFLILPSRSTERDPWADVTGPDGVLDDIVNLRDIQYEILHFNQNVSNMTRDVNVVNPKNDLVYLGAVNVSANTWGLILPYPNVTFSVGNFTRLSVLLANVESYGGMYYMNVSIGLRWSATPMVPNMNYRGTWVYDQGEICSFEICTMEGMGYSYTHPAAAITEVAAPYYQITVETTYVDPIQPAGVYFEVFAYLRNE